MPFLVFTFLFAIFPYFALITQTLHLSTQGKNPILIGILLGLVWVFIASKTKIDFLRNYLPIRRAIVWWVLMVAAMLILFLRALFYNSTWISLLLSVQAVFFLPFCLFLVLKLVDSAKKKQVILNILIWTTILNALVGIIHHYFFPTVNILSRLLVEGYGFIENSREVGLQGNASAYAYFLVLGMLAIIQKVSSDNVKRSQVIYFFFSLILCWGIILSISRGPIIVALVLFAYIAYCLRGSKLFWLMMVIISFVGIYIGYELLGETLKFFSYRVEGGDISRAIKYSLALNMLFSNTSHFILGVPSQVIATTEVNGFLFSDNSYLTVALDFGVIFAILFLGCYIQLLLRLFKEKNQLMLLAIYLIAMFFTNAILWNYWILYVMALLVCLGKSNE